MHRPHSGLIIILALAGCVSTKQQTTAKLTPITASAATEDQISQADRLVAVAAAKRSKYFPGTERCETMAVNPRQIYVLYYDPRGTVVIVKRVHGRWEVVDHSFGWQD